MSIEFGPSNIAGYERREVLRDSAEELEIAVCQRAILAKACGRELDPEEDASLLSTITAMARPAQTDGEYDLVCGVVACGRTDEVSLETGGVLRQLRGSGVCYETSVIIGKGLLSKLDLV